MTILGNGMFLLASGDLAPALSKDNNGRPGGIFCAVGSENLDDGMRRISGGQSVSPADSGSFSPGSTPDLAENSRIASQMSAASGPRR